MANIKKIIKFIGIVFILLALVANPFVMGKLFSSEKQIKALSTKMIVISFELIFFSLGLYLFFNPRKYKNVLLFFIVLILFWWPFDFLITKHLQIKLDVPYRQEHEIYHHSFVPNSNGSLTTSEFTTDYKINSKGLRNPEILPKNDKTRILVLGDSFTEGYVVNYSDSMINKLNNYLGENFEVINGGVASYSPTLEYLYLINDGIKLDPDIVLLNYDITDVHDDIAYSKNSLFDQEGNLFAVTSQERWEFNKDFHFTSRVLDKIIPQKSHIEKPEEDPYFHTRLADCSEFETEWRYSLKYLKATKAYLTKLDIPLFITVYPRGHQVATNQWVDGRSWGQFSKNKTYPFAIASCFETHTDGENFTVFNLLSDFKEAAKNQKLFYNWDVHLTKEGNEVMAYGIYRRLILSKDLKAFFPENFTAPHT